MGLGWEELRRRWADRSGAWIRFTLLGLLLATSLVILSLDYWRVERLQERQLAPWRSDPNQHAPWGADRGRERAGSHPAEPGAAAGMAGGPGKGEPEGDPPLAQAGGHRPGGQPGNHRELPPFADGPEKQKLVRNLCRLQADSPALA